HYADYNLFYNPDSPGLTDYTLPVEPDDMTPIAKGSDGFAKHDVHGDPKFAGPLPKAFPYNADDVKSGAVKVSEILKHYRALYTPLSGSPLTGAGDPQGGPNNNIGAIGQGSDKDPSDQFGTLMPGMGGGPPLFDGGTGGPSGPGSGSGAGGG